MMKIGNEALTIARHISDFLNTYAPSQKTGSMHTLKSYQTTLALYIGFLESIKGITQTSLNGKCFERPFIEEWLGWLAANRGCCPETCNNRLASLRAFLKYLGSRGIQFLYLYNDASAIDRRKCQKKKVEGLSRDAVKALMACPDTKTASGRRDLTFMILLYSTAARLDDLDFITPGWSGDYVVLSAQVRRGGGTTYFYEDNHPPINENLYSRSVNLICTATTNDATSYGTTQAALALTWARNIRAALSSSDLNCLGTQVKSSRQLVFPTGNYSGNRSVAATHYGAGELVMNPMTSNGEIFHTCDLTIAADLNIIPRNRWVKVTYGSKSIIARCNDTAPSGTVDLSYGGVSQALGYPGGGNVTISTP